MPRRKKGKIVKALSRKSKELVEVLNSKKIPQLILTEKHGKVTGVVKLRKKKVRI